MSAFKTNIDPIEHLFGPLQGKSLLDIGCGRGRLCRALAKRGAKMSGLDPQEAMLEIARETAPTAAFTCGGAEDMPFPDETFDGAIILNSLHHVPRAVMGKSLSEALRVVKQGGIFLILEPLARGGYQAVFEPIDDETEVREAALAEIRSFTDRTGTEVLLRTEYETMVPEESAESVLSGGLRVDPSRAALIEEQREAVTRLFAEHVQQTERGPALDQPMIAVALKKK